MHDIFLNYFPHKDACPQDGKPCLKNECKFWLGEKRCWEIEFGEILEEIFGTNRHDYIHFKDETGSHIEGIRHIHFALPISERKKFDDPTTLWATLGFNSNRLAARVQEKFDLLDWEIENVAHEGGDDTDLKKIIMGSPDQREEIIKFLIKVRDMMPAILIFEKDINTCQMCKNKCFELREYLSIAICASCETRIILENIEKYFPS